MTFRVRQMDPMLDMKFGRGGLEFVWDSPEAVAQCIYTRLCLWEGEWFLDLAEGTPWMQEILGHQPSRTVDALLRARIAGTPYVSRIYDYASFYDPALRTFTVSCKVITAFGAVTTAPPGAAISPSGALVMSFSPQPVYVPPTTPIASPPLQLARR